MLGVGVQNKTKNPLEKNLMSKRKASVPLTQTSKFNMFKVKQGIQAELSAVEKQVTQTLNANCSEFVKW